jgi:hypothetical protein
MLVDDTEAARGVPDSSFRWRINALRVARLSRPAGQLPKLESRSKDHTLAIWDRHRIRHVGLWNTVVGESNNALTYLLAWESLADREVKWTAFQNDPAWLRARDESERDGPIVSSYSNQILMPTSFSWLK